MKLEYVVKDDTYKAVKDVLEKVFRISKRLALKLKLGKHILLNNMPCNMKDAIKRDDTLTINLDYAEDNSNIFPLDIPLDIIYEDDSFLIINKPSGLAIHPSLNHYYDNLSSAVKAYFDKIELQKKIRPVNRLDKDTSGLVVFAKNEYIQECLIKQMADHVFQKEYIAVLDGLLEERSGTINLPIARKKDSIIERCISDDGDIAVTKFELIKYLDNKLSLVKFSLETGRTHQIRVHVSAIGHPIIGDTLYGKSLELIDRQALHAYKIRFIHPIYKTTLSYTAPIPTDIQKVRGLISNL